MNWKLWRAGLLIAALSGFLTGLVAYNIAEHIDFKKFAMFLAACVAKDALFWLKQHPVPIEPENQTPGQTMKLTLLAATAAFIIASLTGCTSITATSVTATGTNTFKTTSFLAKNTVDKLDVASTTKTTTKLIGAKNAEVSGDVEMVKALAEFMGSAIAAGAKAAAK